MYTCMCMCVCTCAHVHACGVWEGEWLMSSKCTCRIYNNVFSHSPDFSALAIALRKMVMNHSREYWYMGSMLERSVVQKKRSCVRTATGMYSLRVASISRSVCSASTTLACREEGEMNGGKGRGGRDEWREGRGGRD